MRRPKLRTQLALWFALAVGVSLLLFSSAVLAVIWFDEEAERAQPQGVAAMNDAGEDLERVLWAMLLAAPVGVLGAAALGYAVAGRALAPLRDASARARASRAAALDLRLPTTGRGDEWDELATTMNELLAAARSAMERIRGFTADAAHELRTPLTAIIGEADVTLRRERTAEEHRAALLLIREEADRLAKVVSGLLLLARADGKSLLERRGRVAVLSLIRRVAERSAPAAASSGRTIEVRGAELEVDADAALLERLIENLVANALVHGGGTIELSVQGEADIVRLRVTDQGPGVPEAIASSLFERFVRGDSARSGGGFGLGLALASEIAQAHGGTLTLESKRSPTTFTLTLPRAGR